MRSLWRRVQWWPIWLRWPTKWLVFLLVLFLVLYPRPGLFLRHVDHVRRLDELADPDEPAAGALAARFAAYLAEAGVEDGDGTGLLQATSDFVRREIPYGWDWEVWSVADYVPTVREVIAKGVEDCDGRAVLAATLLRIRGIDARLVGDARHMWVSTPMGDTMSPLGRPAFHADSEGTHIRWGALLDMGPLAVGISVFPLARELLILVTLWLLLLPPEVRWKRSLIAFFLLLEGLIIIRLAGSDIVSPRGAAACWGGLHLPAAAAMVWKKRGRLAKHTGRSVY